MGAHYDLRQKIRFSLALVCLLVCPFVCLSVLVKCSGNVRNAMRNNWLDFGSDQWAVCVSVSILLENL